MQKFHAANAAFLLHQYIPASTVGSGQEDRANVEGCGVLKTQI